MGRSCRGVESRPDIAACLLLYLSFRRVLCPAFTITTNGQNGILQAAGKILKHGKMRSNSAVRYKVNTNDRSRSAYLHWIFRLGLAQGARGRTRPAARGPSQADERLP